MSCRCYINIEQENKRKKNQEAENMSSLQQIVSDAERLANRLKERQAMADNILVEAESVNNQLESMRQVSMQHQ